MVEQAGGRSTAPDLATSTSSERVTHQKLRVGVNGLGRTGRMFLRAWWANEQFRDGFDIVAVNVRRKTGQYAHLLEYDSFFGPFPAKIESGDDVLTVGGREMKVFHKSEPLQIDWNLAGVDLVVDATGEFEARDEAAGHLGESVKKVVISSSAKKPDLMVIMGVNEERYDPDKHTVVAAGSCTTNCVVPMITVLHKAFGVEKGWMTTVHSYTNDQNIVDATHDDPRRARAAALNIIPTSTGAARSVGQIFPELDGKINGAAHRVPTPDVSLVDLVTDLEQQVNKNAVNEAFLAAAEGRLRGYMQYEEGELVSSDFRGNQASVIYDSKLAEVLPMGGEGDMVRTVGWYDNEYGYACRLADLVVHMGRQGLK